MSPSPHTLRCCLPSLFALTSPAQRAVPPAKRERLEQVVRKIDEINSRDPTRVSVGTVWGEGVGDAGEMSTRIFRWSHAIVELLISRPFIGKLCGTLQVPINGVPTAYRVVYSDWVLNWARQLDPKASDELVILAKGVEVWTSYGCADLGPCCPSRCGSCTPMHLAFLPSSLFSPL